jgi:bacterioferritin-associated ferredoxin
MEDIKSPLAHKPDYLVCTCMGVMASEIRQAIMDGNKNFDSLSELLMVGTGCSSCVDEVCELLKQEDQECASK